MKIKLTLFFFLFVNIAFSQTVTQNKNVLPTYDSTYAGPRLGTGSTKFVGNLRGKTESNFI